MKKIKSIKQIFNNKGEWVVYIDPYRCSHDNPIYQYLFDEDGDTNPGIYEEAVQYANEINAPWYSSLVKLIYADRYGCNTKYNYSAIYAWRH